MRRIVTVGPVNMVWGPRYQFNMIHECTANIQISLMLYLVRYLVSFVSSGWKFCAVYGIMNYIYVVGRAYYYELDRWSDQRLPLYRSRQDLAIALRVVYSKYYGSKVV